MRIGTGIPGTPFFVGTGPSSRKIAKKVVKYEGRAARKADRKANGSALHQWVNAPEQVAAREADDKAVKAAKAAAPELVRRMRRNTRRHAYGLLTALVVLGATTGALGYGIVAAAVWLLVVWGVHRNRLVKVGNNFITALNTPVTLTLAQPPPKPAPVRRTKTLPAPK